MKSEINHICVYSAPRSGSTKFLYELAKEYNVVSIPESYFPQLLDNITDDRLNDIDFMAALLVSSFDDGALMSLDEARDFMISKEKTTILGEVAKWFYSKEMINSPEKMVVIWKTTRLVSQSNSLEMASCRFIRLKRNPLNVYDSQFRVNFGKNNRNLVRFAFFYASYDAALNKLKKDLTINIDFSDIPNSISNVANFLDLDKRKDFSVNSFINSTSAKQSHHSRINEKFLSRDHIQIKNLSKITVALLPIMLKLLSYFPSIMLSLRRIYDKKQASKQFLKAKDFLNN